MTNEVEAFERATRRSRTIKIALLLLVIGSPLIYVGYKNYANRAQIEERREAYEQSIALTAADNAELAAMIPRARTSIEDAGNRFRQRRHASGSRSNTRRWSATFSTRR